MDYFLIRTKRKTLAIHVTRSATVEIRAPLRMPRLEIEIFIEEKKEWIEQQVAARQEILKYRQEFSLHYGSSISLRGKLYPIVAENNNTAKFDGTRFCLPSELSAEEIKLVVIQLYKDLARQVLIEKVRFYSERLQLYPQQIKVNSARTHWGSCSGKNCLNFTWRLIMAEESLIDYVVVHELAHIKEHNHSPRFWAVVGSVLPNYQELRKQLKVFSIQLGKENWEM